MKIRLVVKASDQETVEVRQDGAWALVKMPGSDWDRTWPDEETAAKAVDEAFLLALTLTPLRSPVTVILANCREIYGCTVNRRPWIE